MMFRKGHAFRVESRHMNACPHCGASVPVGAAFCPNCGQAVAAAPGSGAAPATPAAERTRFTPPPPQRNAARGWWILPLVLVAIIVIAWLLIAGLPFGDDDPPPLVGRTETIAEAPLPGTATVTPIPETLPPNTAAPTGTIVDDTGTIGIFPPRPQQPVPLNPQPPPGQSPATQPPPVTPPPVQTPPPPQTQPPPRTQPPPAEPPRREPPVATPPPRETPPPPPREPARPEPREISETDAIARVRAHIIASDTYDIPPSCVSVRGRGRSGDGYTVDVWNTCVGGGGSRRVGQWRVDARTRELSRRR